MLVVLGESFSLDSRSCSKNGESCSSSGIAEALSGKTGPLFPKSDPIVHDQFVMSRVGITICVSLAKLGRPAKPVSLLVKLTNT